MWGYKQVSVVDHPRKRGNGCVLEHIIVMEKKLGRYLYDGEVVHHVDSDRSNNSPDNLRVFVNQRHHAIYHSHKYIRLAINNHGAFYCETLERLCVECGNELNSQQTKYCSLECTHKNDGILNISQRKCERPSKDELKSLLIEMNFSKVAKMYDVSDNSIRKWCKGYGMSTKAKDYKL